MKYNGRKAKIHAGADVVIRCGSTAEFVVRKKRWCKRTARANDGDVREVRGGQRDVQSRMDVREGREV